MSWKTWTSGQFIALFCILLSTGLAFSIFVYSRGDHDMKLLALGAAISQISALMATASTMLVGKVFDSNTAGGSKLLAFPDGPPGGSRVTEATTLETPPLSQPAAAA